MDTLKINYPCLFFYTEKNKDYGKHINLDDIPDSGQLEYELYLDDSKIKLSYELFNKQYKEREYSSLLQTSNSTFIVSRIMIASYENLLESIKTLKNKGCKFLKTTNDYLTTKDLDILGLNEEDYVELVINESVN